MNDKTNDIIETLEGIRDRIGKKKNKGIGHCLICDILTDDSDAFTCGHPQCNETLKEEMSARKDLLKELGVSSIKGAVEKVRQIQTIADEIKSKL
jgi:hypothetical protein